MTPIAMRRVRPSTQRFPKKMKVPIPTACMRYPTTMVSVSTERDAARGVRW